ncbi:hypothetical protein DOT66_00060 [Ralstonia pseudosolanacearum]|nr:hypothetical protein CFM90_07755 [Ralstonia solanacearum]RAA14264.1 hypothetical protein DOT66_00060 [Ralstonia pseudosolanacearum]
MGKRSAQALKGRRRQGSKPDGRDSVRGAGRSPRARRRNAGTAVVHQATRKGIRCAANMAFMPNIRYSAVIR